MSVYKSKRGESSVQFIETARQLEAHTFACCMKAPKRYERFLTGRIMELSSEVHDRVRAANNIWPTNRHEAQLRRDELMRANNALQNLSPKLQLLYDSILQNPEGYGWIHKAMQRWGDLICEEAKLIAAVKKFNGSAGTWWERSPNGSNSTNFCNVNSNGNANYNNASNANGVAFGFCKRWVRTVTGSGEAAPLQKESLFLARPKQSSDAVSRTLLAWRANVRTARSMAGTATRIEHAPKNNSVQGMP